MPETQEQKEIEMNIRDYLFIFHKRRWVILGVFLFISVLTLIHISRQTPVYRAAASVRILERKTVANLLTDWFTLVPGDPITSQARVIESYPVIERVAKELGLVKPNATSKELMMAVISLQSAVKATPVKETNVIRITVEDKSAEGAALIANKVAQSYIEENLKEKTRQAHAVKEFVQEQLDEIERKLTAAEDKRKEFQESGKATGIAIPLQNRLSGLETEKAKLLRNYTELHPDVVKIKEEVNTLKEQIKLMPDLEVEFARLTREVEVNEKSYRALKEKLEDARIAEAENVPDVTLVDPASAPSNSVRPNKLAVMVLGLFLGLSLGLVAGFGVEQLDTSIGTIEDVERYLALPVLGVIPYLEVEVSLEKRPFIKTISLFFKREKNESKGNLNKQLLINYSSQSAIAEAYRILRTNIVIEVLKNQTKGRTILVSSAGPQEGKSINISNLGICLAQAGHKVIVVDLDLRRPVIDKIFCLPPHHRRGLSDVLRQTVKLEDAILSLTDLLIQSKEIDKILSVPGIDNLNFLLSGTPVSNPSELLGSQNMSLVLEKLKEKFDIVLFDTPPILAVTDAVLLAPKVDAVILVYKVGKTASAAIMRTKKQLEGVGVSCKGIILNNISTEVEMRSQYYYYRYHYYYPPKGKEK